MKISSLRSRKGRQRQLSGLIFGDTSVWMPSKVVQQVLSLNNIVASRKCLFRALCNKVQHKDLPDDPPQTYMDFLARFEWPEWFSALWLALASRPQVPWGLYIPWSKTAPDLHMYIYIVCVCILQVPKHYSIADNCFRGAMDCKKHSEPFTMSSSKRRHLYALVATPKTIMQGTI